ncbi:MAG: hypothetical protein ABIH03_11580 [Pseudomonadota bacterium]
MTLDHYCALFSKLTRAPGRMWGEGTRNHAPHKPLLLLALMDHCYALARTFVQLLGDEERLEYARARHLVHTPAIVAYRQRADNGTRIQEFFYQNSSTLP